MKIAWLLLGISLLALCNTAVSVDNPKSKDLDDDMHFVNFYLTSNDAQVAIRTLMCRGWPCPKFNVKRDHTRFIQERVYDSFDIISATVSQCGNFSTCLQTGYFALYRYRKGGNSEKRNVNMTTPVIVQVSKGSDQDNDDDEYKVFVMSPESNIELPEPTEDNVKIERIQKLDVYVRSYTYFSKDEEVQLAKLKSELDLLKLCYNTNNFMAAFYDPPWRIKGRRNEIWVETKDCPS